MSPTGNFKSIKSKPGVSVVIIKMLHLHGPSIEEDFRNSLTIPSKPAPESGGELDHCYGLFTNFISEDFVIKKWQNEKKRSCEIIR